MNLARDDLQAMPLEHAARLVASVWQKTGRTGGDRAFADRRGFGENAVGVDLVAPVVRLANTPARRREREPMHRSGAAPPEAARSRHSPGYHLGITRRRLTF